MNVNGHLHTLFAPDMRARSSRRVPVGGGRALGIATFGRPDGPPILYFHGFPSSRLEPALLPLADVRVIGIDRPGYGLSDPDPPGRSRLLGFAQDIAALTAALGITRYGLLGMSGGAPYAAAVAASGAPELAALALVSGLGPPEAPGMNEGRVGLLLGFGRRPAARKAAFALARHAVRWPAAADSIIRLRRSMPHRTPRDDAVLTDAVAQGLIACWREGLAPGTAGAEADACAYGEAWPFRLEDIRVPVSLWHGVDDTIVPVSIGRHYAARLPGAATAFIPEEGHISLIANHYRAILAEIMRHLQ